MFVCCRTFNTQLYRPVCCCRPTTTQHDSMQTLAVGFVVSTDKFYGMGIHAFFGVIWKKRKPFQQETNHLGVSTLHRQTESRPGHLDRLI